MVDGLVELDDQIRHGTEPGERSFLLDQAKQFHVAADLSVGALILDPCGIEKRTVQGQHREAEGIEPRPIGGFVLPAGGMSGSWAHSSIVERGGRPPRGKFRPANDQGVGGEVNRARQSASLFRSPRAA